MNEAQRIIEDIYDEGLGAVVRLISDDLNIDTTYGMHDPLLEPGLPAEHTEQDAAYMEPGSQHNPIYVGRRDGLTVTTRADQLNEAYAKITTKPLEGPYIQSMHNNDLTVHHRNPERHTEPVQVRDREIPLIDKENLAHYLQAPHPTMNETGVTTVKVNPSHTDEYDDAFDVTNAEAYNVRQILNMTDVPLVDQTTNPSYVRDHNISHS